MLERELGKPLQAMALSLDMVVAARARGDMAPGWLDERLEAMRGAADRMQRGMEVIVAAEAIREGRVAFAPEALDLTEVARRVADQIGREVAWKGTTLFVDGDASLQGRWDRASLELVLGILLREAARTAPGSPIGARLLLDAGVRINVASRVDGKAEDGGGPSTREAAGDTAEREDGRSVALWVARELVAALGGTMSATASPVGVAFQVDLPLSS